MKYKVKPLEWEFYPKQSEWKTWIHTDRIIVFSERPDKAVFLLYKELSDLTAMEVYSTTEEAKQHAQRLLENWVSEWLEGGEIKQLQWGEEGGADGPTGLYYLSKNGMLVHGCEILGVYKDRSAAQEHHEKVMRQWLEEVNE